MCRPGKYYSGMAEIVSGMLMIRNYTVEELSEALGISVTTFYDYQNKYSEFSKAVKMSRELAVARMRNNLMKKSDGIKWDEEAIEVEYLYDETGNKIGERVLKAKKTRKFIPPSDVATIFGLKNLDKENFRDSLDHNVSGDIEITLNFDSNLQGDDD